ncbi:hypothetical protein Nepgr_002646 [Nepenthes gracilis]|uniref:Uncharacterized protein n=1 Tax=Nepenthes gracilis TaxID=150966 RepID=A0AAD3P7F4_NEPGR|nr:hypothetical protein Nepgr_002646 [Nepenthes gracilis]
MIGQTLLIWYDHAGLALLGAIDPVRWGFLPFLMLKRGNCANGVSIVGCVDAHFAMSPKALLLSICISIPVGCYELPCGKGPCADCVVLLLLAARLILEPASGNFGLCRFGIEWPSRFMDFYLALLHGSVVNGCFAPFFVKIGGVLVSHCWRFTDDGGDTSLRCQLEDCHDALATMWHFGLNGCRANLVHKVGLSRSPVKPVLLHTGNVDDSVFASWIWDLATLAADYVDVDVQPSSPLMLDGLFLYLVSGLVLLCGHVKGGPAFADDGASNSPNGAVWTLNPFPVYWFRVGIPNPDLVSLVPSNSPDDNGAVCPSTLREGFCCGESILIPRTCRYSLFPFVCRAGLCFCWCMLENRRQALLFHLFAEWSRFRRGKPLVFSCRVVLALWHDMPYGLRVVSKYLAGAIVAVKEWYRFSSRGLVVRHLLKFGAELAELQL